MALQKLTVMELLLSGSDFHEHVSNKNIRICYLIAQPDQSAISAGHSGD